MSMNPLTQILLCVIYSLNSFLSELTPCLLLFESTNLLSAEASLLTSNLIPSLKSIFWNTVSSTFQMTKTLSS